MKSNPELAPKYLVAIRAEVERARAGLEQERKALLDERDRLEARLKQLDDELHTVKQLGITATDSRPPADATVLDTAVPLSRRVLKVLDGCGEQGMTFRQICDVLHLDKREARNLGPVLFHLAKAHKVVGAGRGLPWRRA